MLVLIHPALLSQQKNDIKATVNNLFRYGNGEELFSGISRSKEYFENFTDARLSINKFTFGLRFEISKPAELGLNYKGIRKRYVEYSNSDNFEVCAGNFWEIIGRGMTLNSFEQRQLAFDTGLDGVRIIFKKAFDQRKNYRIKSEFLAGSLEYSDYQKPERIEEYDIKDANLEFSLFSSFNIGFNYVYAKGIIPVGNANTDVKAYLPEVYLSYNSPKFQIFSAYAHKKIDVEANDIYPVSFSSGGDGFYTSANYTLPGLGITFEYKNYRFDLTSPDNQSTERATKVLPFQNPPVAVKQQTSVLSSRIPHAGDFNDEAGCQLDIIFMPQKNLSLNLNTSIASRHYSFFDADTSSKVQFIPYKRVLNFLPSFEDSYSPYTEISIEAEYDISQKLFGKLGFIYQNDITYNYFFNEASDKKRYITIPAEIRFDLSKDLSFKILYEQQWAKNSFRPSEFQNFTNYFAAFTITKSPFLSFSLNAEFTSDKLEPSGKNTWIEAETSWNITASNIITAAFGSERGGLRCSSGICKFINPFSGFRLTIQNKL